MAVSNTMMISQQFFTELKQYNGTNFKKLYSADLNDLNPSDLKAFSSVVTRYMIFCEKHPEFSELEKHMLWFQLKLDMIARFFADYPKQDTSNLVAFQTEIKYFVDGSDDNE